MSITSTKSITPEVIEDAMTYPEYRKKIDALLEEGKTTGPKQSEQMTGYTRMNVHRMNRLDKRTKLNESLEKKLDELKQDWIWLVLTEAWCGDAAQNVPAINKIAESSDNISLRLILRDQHHDIMDQYLTNGGRAIPKLICLDADTLEEIGTWGPRPEYIQEKAHEWKDDPKISSEEWKEKLHKWYAKNRTKDIQEEFEQLIEKWQ